MVDRTVADLAALVALVRERRVAVLTGAGCSTGSGIPDYRGAGRAPRNPIEHRDFLHDAETRVRYWARSFVGWPRFASAEPNAAHHALATLERSGVAVGIITQNVDRLHHAAGSRRVVELHGALAHARCLECGTRVPRDALQRRLAELNPGFADCSAELAPDGDAELDAQLVSTFRIAACETCSGVLKPEVVFFGGNVPAEVVQAGFALHDEADALLVVGSSLAVFSGYRFVRRAAQQGKPVAIVNLGQTRGDPLATLRVEGDAGAILSELTRQIGAARRDESESR